MDKRHVVAMADAQTDPLAAIAEARMWALQRDNGGQQPPALDLAANLVLGAMAAALAHPELAAELIVKHAPSDELARRFVTEQGEFFRFVMERMRGRGGSSELRRLSLN